MDWTTSVQALTDRARSSYKSAIGEWQELLKKVARGELAPAVLEDRLPEFLQDEGADFYRRLLAASFELFNGLSELQANSTREFMRGLLGNSAVDESPAPLAPALPSADAAPEEWTRWYHGVMAFLTEQNEIAVRRYQVLLEKVADSKLTPANVQEFSRKFMNERVLVFSRDAGELQMRFYEKLLQLNQEFIASLFAGLAREANAPVQNSDSPIRIECLESGASAGGVETSTSPDAGDVAPATGKPADFRTIGKDGAPSSVTPPTAQAAAPAKAKRRHKSTASRRRKKGAR